MFHMSRKNFIELRAIKLIRNNNKTQFKAKLIKHRIYNELRAITKIKTKSLIFKEWPTSQNLGRQPM